MEILTTSEAYKHCELLSNLIDEAIKKNGGWLPFSQFMNHALYSAQGGYYTSGAIKFGAQGDFITAPEISHLFGSTLAHTIAPALRFFSKVKEDATILEFGAGSGKLCQDVLGHLQQIDQLPNSYQILELSPDLIDRQQRTIQAFLKEHHISTKVEWLSAIPQNFKGVVLANEVLDAIPFDIIIRQQNTWHYHVLATNPNPRSPSFSDHWIWKLGAEVPTADLPSYLQQSSFPYPENYVTEMHPRSQAWIELLAQSMSQGLVMTIDYGFPEKEYYHPQRTQGTHIAHYRHQAIHDMFYMPGLCDLTAHVEWSTVHRVATNAGLSLSSYQSQGAYLLAAGIGDLFMAQVSTHDTQRYTQEAHNLQKLISEAEMGELFKIMALCKDSSEDKIFEYLCAQLPGFTNRQRLLEV